MRQPFHLRGDPVKYISVCHEIAFLSAIQLILFHDLDIREAYRSEIIQEIIVIPPDINHLSPAFLHHLHDDFEELRMRGLPLSCAVLFDMPSVDNISVQNQAVAIDGTQEIAHFLNFRVGRS